MIDIHSHILPNIDDGASNLAEAFTMLKMAVDNGVTTQVLTPHIHHGRFDNTKQGITEKFEQFSAEVDKENIPIRTLWLISKNGSEEEVKDSGEVIKLE